MKRNCYSVEIPDTDYWKSQIKCQNACPVQTDARGYVRAIAAGDFEKAYLIARGPNPLASICGRICGAPCELECRRSSLDEPISIRALKRFITEKYGAESGKYDESPLKVIDRLLSASEEEHMGFEDIKNLLRGFRESSLSEESPSVGIIGAGPAGLVPPQCPAGPARRSDRPRDAAVLPHRNPGRRNNYIQLPKVELNRPRRRSGKFSAIGGEPTRRVR